MSDMADYSYGEITIGGIVSTKQLAEIAQTLGIKSQKLLDSKSTLHQGAVTWKDDQAAFNQFNRTERLCRKIGLPFILKSSAYCEFAERHFDGQELRERIFPKADSKPVVMLCDLEAAMKIPNGVQDIIKSHRFFDVGLPALYIVDMPRERMNAIGGIKEWAAKEILPEIALHAISNFSEVVDAGS